MLRVGVDAVVSAVQRFTCGQRVVYYKGSVRNICVVVAYEDRDTGAIIKEPRVLVRGAGIVKPVAESRLSPYRHSWRTSVMRRPKRATLALLLFVSHRRVLYGGRAAAETSSTKCSPTASSNDLHKAFKCAYSQGRDKEQRCIVSLLLKAMLQDTEKEDCRAKPSSPFTESRWDDDLRRVNEELSAGTRMVDMEVMRSHLDDMPFMGTVNNFPGAVFDTGRHSVCAQTPYSLKPSVKARASKLEKRSINIQKQKKRRWRRIKNRRESYSKTKVNCCAIDALRGFGLRAAYDRDGPFSVEDVKKMLRPFGYTMARVSGIRRTGPGRWLVCRHKHCIGLQRKVDRHTWSIDGRLRKLLGDRDVEALVQDAKIYEVPSKSNFSCRRCHCLHSGNTSIREVMLS